MGILLLIMEDWDLVDNTKFPHLVGQIHAKGLL